MADCTKANYDINVAATEAAEVVAKYSRLTASEAYDLIVNYMRNLADEFEPGKFEEASDVTD